MLNGVLFCLGCQASSDRDQKATTVFARFAGYEQAHGDTRYLSLLAASAARDEAAIRQFLSYDKQYRFEGAASEGHAEVLGYFLRYTGDSFFGRALSDCDVKAQNYVRGLLYFDMACDSGVRSDSAAESLLHDQYPITFAVN